MLKVTSSHILSSLPQRNDLLGTLELQSELLATAAVGGGEGGKDLLLLSVGGGINEIFAMYEVQNRTLTP